MNTPDGSTGAPGNPETPDDETFEHADLASCYRVLNLMALVRNACDAIELSAISPHSGLAAGVRECSRIATDIVSGILDKIEHQMGEA